MDKDLLQQSVNILQKELFQAITTKTYNGKKYSNGQKAKEALIRSQTLIMNVHEAVKKSVFKSLTRTQYRWEVHPPLGKCAPELKIYGKLKGKDQDLVFLRAPQNKEQITSGPNVGEVDKVGFEATRTAVVIGVRSQMSSINKNFDTLMERAFAETLNLRLRAPELTMGEVYLLPGFFSFGNLTDYVCYPGSNFQF